MSANPVLRKYRKQSWEYNRCAICGKFKRWHYLVLNFVPDSAFSSENESYRECRRCIKERAARKAART